MKNQGNILMNPKYFIRVISLMLISINFIKVAGAETLTVTTYYPSPYRIYNKVRLVETDSFDPLAVCSDKGEMYYDDSDNQMYVCNGTSWQSSQSYWTRNLNDIYPNDINWNVGIGTNNPSEKLDVVGNILVTGDINLSGQVSGIDLDCIMVVNSRTETNIGFGVQVDCPAGYTVSGGGGNCRCTGGVGISALWYTRPAAVNRIGTACVMVDGTGCLEHTVTVYAQCCRVN